MIRRIGLGVSVWLLLTFAASAQEPCPPGSISVDRFGFLCLPGTGEAFGDVAGGSIPARIIGKVSSHTSSTSSAQAAYPSPRRRNEAAATPSIILAHQKLASDGVVLAHDEYDWINRGGYRNKQGDHCCGKDDCFKLRPGEVKEVPGGYEVPSHGVTVPHQDAMPSEDGHYWICRTSAKFRCFFRPYSGS